MNSRDVKTMLRSAGVIPNRIRCTPNSLMSLRLYLRNRSQWERLNSLRSNQKIGEIRLVPGGGGAAPISTLHVRTEGRPLS